MKVAFNLHTEAGSGFKWMLGVLLIGFSTASFSQTKDAGAILEKTVSKYNEYGSGMEIVFTANVRSAKTSVNESFEGTLAVKGDKFVLNTPDVNNWFNGKTLWSYMVRTQEVNVSTPTGSELQSVNPLFLIRNYKKDFTVLCTGESTTQNSKMAYDVAMTPKKKDDIEKVELQIEKSTSLPSRIVIRIKNDVYITLTVKSVNPVNMPDEKFTFPEKDFPDAEIIDLR